MNPGWFGVPPLGGSDGLDRLKPGLQAVRGCMVPMHALKRKGALHEPQGAAGILPAVESEKTLPTRRRQHPVGVTARLVRGSWSQCIRENEQPKIRMTKDKI